MKKHLSLILTLLSIFFISNVYAMAAADPHALDKQLLQAVARHDVAGAHALLDAGADINYEGEVNIFLLHETPLSLAVYTGYEDMVNMLLEYESPNPHITHDGILKTLLITEQLKTNGKLDPDYCFHPKLTIPALNGLFTKPLAIDKKNHRGETALFAHEASAAIMQKLIDHGADINAIDNDGNTPLICAVNNNDPSALQVLINNKADLNKKNINGSTALHQASWQRKLNMVDALIRAGGDQSILDNSGRTAKWRLEEKYDLEAADKWLRWNSYEDQW